MCKSNSSCYIEKQNLLVTVSESFHCPSDSFTFFSIKHIVRLGQKFGNKLRGECVAELLSFQTNLNFLKSMIIILLSTRQMLTAVIQKMRNMPCGQYVRKNVSLFLSSFWENSIFYICLTLWQTYMSQIYALV